VNAVAAAIRKHSLLLLQDKTVLNAVTIITGERVAGSWWSHPRSNEIFRIVDEVKDSRDIVLAKLVGGKVTFIHRRLWPALFAVGGAREPWQTRGLSRAATTLLRRIEAEGSVQASGAAVKELESRLLVRSEEVHTESGKHATMLRLWPSSRLRVETARRKLEAAVIAIGGTTALLPWHRGDY
jgi:hypothetical protein